jgi:hypothetical protein
MPVGSWKCYERWCATGHARAGCEANERLGLRLRHLAEERRRLDTGGCTFGGKESWQVNSKRVYRIYVEEKLVVRTRKRRQRSCAQARCC